MAQMEANRKGIETTSDPLIRPYLVDGYHTAHRIYEAQRSTSSVRKGKEEERHPLRRAIRPSALGTGASDGQRGRTGRGKETVGKATERQQGGETVPQFSRPVATMKHKPLDYSKWNKSFDSDSDDDLSTASQNGRQMSKVAAPAAEPPQAVASGTKKRKKKKATVAQQVEQSAERVGGAKAQVQLLISQDANGELQGSTLGRRLSSHSNLVAKLVDGGSRKDAEDLLLEAISRGAANALEAIMKGIDDADKGFTYTDKFRGRYLVDRVVDAKHWPLLKVLMRHEASMTVKALRAVIMEWNVSVLSEWDGYIWCPKFGFQHELCCCTKEFVEANDPYVEPHPGCGECDHTAASLLEPLFEGILRMKSPQAPLISRDAQCRPWLHTSESAKCHYDKARLLHLVANFQGLTADQKLSLGMCAVRSGEAETLAYLHSQWGAAFLTSLVNKGKVRDPKPRSVSVARSELPLALSFHCGRCLPTSLPQAIIVAAEHRRFNCLRFLRAHYPTERPFATVATCRHGWDCSHDMRAGRLRFRGFPIDELHARSDRKPPEKLSALLCAVRGPGAPDASKPATTAQACEGQRDERALLATLRLLRASGSGVDVLGAKATSTGGDSQELALSWQDLVLQQGHSNAVASLLGSGSAERFEKILQHNRWRELQSRLATAIESGDSRLVKSTVASESIEPSCLRVTLTDGENWSKSPCGKELHDALRELAQGSDDVTLQALLGSAGPASSVLANFAFSTNMTMLQTAVSANRRSTVHLLLEGRANVLQARPHSSNAVAAGLDGGWTALHYAAAASALECVEALLDTEMGIKAVGIADQRGKLPIDLVPAAKKSASATAAKKIRKVLQKAAETVSSTGRPANQKMPAVSHGADAIAGARRGESSASPTAPVESTGLVDDSCVEEPGSLQPATPIAVVNEAEALHARLHAESAAAARDMIQIDLSKPLELVDQRFLDQLQPGRIQRSYGAAVQADIQEGADVDTGEGGEASAQDKPVGNISPEVSGAGRADAPAAQTLASGSAPAPDMLAPSSACLSSSSSPGTRRGLEERFEDHPWRVLIVRPAARDLSSLDVHDKRAALQSLHTIAAGIWSGHDVKHLAGDSIPSALSLYESKFSKGSRIIWSVGIDFVPFIGMYQVSWRWLALNQSWRGWRRSPFAST